MFLAYSPPPPLGDVFPFSITSGALRSSPRLAKLRSNMGATSLEELELSDSPPSPHHEHGVTANEIALMVVDQTPLTHSVSESDGIEAAVVPQTVPSPVVHSFPAARPSNVSGVVVDSVPVTAIAVPITTDSVVTTSIRAAETGRADVYVDPNGNVFVNASTLSSELVPPTDSNARGATVESGADVGVVDPSGKAVHVEVEQTTNIPPSSSVPAKTVLYDIDPPMWNFTSQSPEVVPQVPSKSVPASVSVAGASVTAHPTEFSRVKPVAGTSSTEDPGPGDFSISLKETLSLCRGHHLVTILSIIFVIVKYYIFCCFFIVG